MPVPSAPQHPPHRPPHGNRAAGTALLVPISGPVLEALELRPDARATSNGLVLGRHPSCDLPLPAEAEKVSRMHARLNLDSAASAPASSTFPSSLSSSTPQWRLTDLNSRWGTFLNGVRIAAGQQMPLSEGDLIRITPWTFSFTAQPRRGGLVASDDAGHTVVRTVAMAGTETPPARSLRDEMLALLLESAAAIHSADDEKQLAELVMDSAMRGTGLTNAVMLRPLDAQGRVEVIASRFATPGAHDAQQPATFSRSLLAAAAQGQVAELSNVGGGLAAAPADIGQSIVTMKISAALCVPLMLGGAPAAFLYLDTRGLGSPMAQTIRPGATAFCAALGRMASLALANLKRIDVERRQALYDAELRAAAAAQRWILPQRLTKAGRFTCIGESRPGRYVGGDFFDLIDLGNDRLAVALGDVAGKGIAASVLMTATQGFLHAALSSGMSSAGTESSASSRAVGEDACGLALACARAVQSANRYVNPRKPEGKFVTLWVGVFDLRARTLCYVDAGHSYALFHRAADGSVVSLDRGEGLPLGVAEDHQFTYVAETVELPDDGGAVMVVSDGIVEQPAASTSGAAPTDRFMMDRVRTSLAESLSAQDASPDPVAQLFDAVVEYAGTTELADDATAVLVRWAANA